VLGLKGVCPFLSSHSCSTVGCKKPCLLIVIIKVRNPSLFNKKVDQ